MVGPSVAQLAFRSATADDAPFAADVMTALFPRSPWDPVSLRYWWSQPDESMEVARFIVLRGERPIGFAQFDHARWDLQPERYASIWGDLTPVERTRDLLSALLAGLEERASAEGARILRVRAEEDDALRIGTVLARGYKEDRRHKRLELDLIANRDALLAMTNESRARMRREGVQLITLADDRDPEVVRKIWLLSEEAGDDVPTTIDTSARYLFHMHGTVVEQLGPNAVGSLGRYHYRWTLEARGSAMTSWAYPCSGTRRCAGSSGRSGRRPLGRCAAAASRGP